jgi:hypothetical protein
MSIDEQVELVVHQNRQVVINDFVQILVPLTPQRVVLNRSFPDNARVILPFTHSPENKLVLLVPVIYLFTRTIVLGVIMGLNIRVISEV